MALIAIVQNDIKRVVAYSTLSQLGYMTVALGASAYSAAIFHLMTHAFFKAVLFLGAGSVIIAMHHEQDMRRMGGLRKYMPITYGTMLIGALAHGRHPAVRRFLLQGRDHRGGAPRHGAGRGLRLRLRARRRVRHRALLLPAGVHAFHGEERFRHAGGARGTATHGHDDHGHAHEPHESPGVVTVPLILLAIPSICAGLADRAVVFGGYFGDSIVIAPRTTRWRSWRRTSTASSA